MIKYILRYGSLAQLIIEEIAKGKEVRPRPRHTYIEHIMNVVGIKKCRKVTYLANTNQEELCQTNH